MQKETTITITKERKGIATVIEFEGNRYILQHENQYKGNGAKKNG